MTNSKKGISLIVLIITIIVIIILAGAVILSLNNTNIIDNSNKAVLKQNQANVQDAVTLFIANNSIQENGLYGKVEITTEGEIGNTAMVKLPGKVAEKLTFELLGITKPATGKYSVSTTGLVTATNE